ncbi:MAG: hypothetical protein IJM01_03525, partial [Eubacterium sp.]|nr:hypothetical protein [Eubacterium sp.]
NSRQQLSRSNEPHKIKKEVHASSLLVSLHFLLILCGDCRGLIGSGKATFNQLRWLVASGSQATAAG